MAGERLRAIGERVERARRALGRLSVDRARAALELLFAEERAEGATASDSRAVEGAEPSSHGDVLHAIERAVGSERLVIRYRDGSGHESERAIEPLALHVTGRELYLLAHCLKAEGPRTFRVDRILAARVTGHPIRSRKVDLRGAFGRAERSFTGDPLRVVVRLAPAAAARVDARPLANGQRLEVGADGSAVLRARVDGILEAVRWVLSWGAAAEAIAPPVLRDAVRSELLGALGRYRPGLKRGAAVALARPGGIRRGA